MEIKDIIEGYKLKGKTTEAKSELNELKSKFIDRLNSDRVTGGYKPLKPGVYMIRMAQCGIKSVSGLYWLLGYCNDANDFSKCWWWWTKTNKKKK